ncbi:hypothetical protein GOODEAATRI_004474 [Goodea atripinnis]|uniref:G-protein coupled receptors family 1 profile domain-containing protein n=1 Tax=Goodea atripinnis TaxID=208336 RepID=A0ABV0PVN0_9TELE
MMADMTGSMITSVSDHSVANSTTALWEPNPTVPADVSVVTSSQSQIKDLFGLFCMVTLNLIALLANTGVMVAIARAPHLKRFAFVCHLCAVDLLCAILLMPLGIISSSPFFGTVVFTVLECQVYIFLNVFLICLSILTITAISLERYFYIVHPLLVIFSVYCAVYKVARSAALQQVPAVPTWVNTCPAKGRSDSINSQTNMIATTRTVPQRLSPERAFSGGKAAITLVFIVGQFLVCWLPYFIFHVQMSLTGSMQSPGDLEEAVTWLAYSSFAVNPFFYGLLNRQIRDELVKFRRCCLNQPTEVGASSQEASFQENFLQFIQRTISTPERRSSCSNSSPTNTLNQANVIPGKIPEEHA